MYAPLFYNNLSDENKIIISSKYNILIFILYTQRDFQWVYWIIYKLYKNN